MSTLLRNILRMGQGPVDLASSGILWTCGPIIRWRQRRRIRLAQPSRSLWGGAPIINKALQAQGEKLLGARTLTLVYNTYYITKAFDLNLSRWLQVPLLSLILRHLVFLWACFRFDRLHFFLDAGLLPQRSPGYFNPTELECYRRLQKQVIFWTYGADVRTRFETQALGEPNCCSDCPGPVGGCVCNTSTGNANYNAIRRAATAIFAMGDMQEYTPGSRNDLYFWPVDLNAEQGRRYAPSYPNPDATRPIRIVHAPNHRIFKGTRHLESAVERLRAEGAAIELILVERVPNQQALDIYRTADIIFDQCLVGFHGYFAIEAMAMGKPVMAFIRKPAAYLLHPEECPLIHSAHATQVESVLRELIRDRRKLHELGRQGRRYVEKYFTVQAFAERLRLAYSDLGVS